MKSVAIKYAISISLTVCVIASIPIIGFTTAEVDGTQGMVLDFGYWETEWVEMSFPEGMDGVEALEAACHIKGHTVTFLEDGTVFGVDDQTNLVGVSWRFYVFDGMCWQHVNDPHRIDVSEYGIVSWSRSGGAEDVVPATDATGHTYYGYAQDGISKSTGRQLRVVSLAPSITETVCAVGGLDFLVGTDLYSNYPQEVVDRKDSGEISVIGGYTDPNYEWIIRLAPDLVLCDGGTGVHVEIADKLRKSGIDCVVLNGGEGVDELYASIWTVASAIGMSGNANGVISDIMDTIEVVSGIAGGTGKRVFVSLSLDPSPWTAGAQTYITDIIDRLGGMNVFEGQSTSWFMVSKEQVYAKQPDAMIVINGGGIESWEEYQAILGSMDPVWKETPAYRNGEVYIFSDSSSDLFSRPGPRLMAVAEILAKVMNPDAFTDRDPLDVLPRYIGDDYEEYLRYQVVS